MTDVEFVAELRKRVARWSLNTDNAWIKVPLRELRAALKLLETLPEKPKVDDCPFQNPEYEHLVKDLDDTDPCPVCGMLGTPAAPVLCPFPPKMVLIDKDFPTTHYSDDFYDFHGLKNPNA